MARLHLITTGGTIAMGAERPGEAATLDKGPSDLFAGLPQLAGLADWTIERLLAKPSASLDFADLARIADAVQRAKADGVVITHGTDTLEETAFFLQLAAPQDRPVVLTGAMRPAHAPGADGPANLLAAAQVALSAAARGKGVLVVMDEEIHAAAFVRKAHTARVHAFTSAPLGPLGWVIEGRPRVLTAPAMDLPRLVPGALPTVIPLLEAAIGLTPGEVLNAAAGAHGLVLGLPGGGHVAAPCMEAIEAVARERPLVIASRAGGGEMLGGTYGYPGSETDLLARGVISARFLDPRKARILLALLLSRGATRAQVARTFSAL